MRRSAGANHDDTRGYMPHITSYDYGAPVSESGLLTDKFRVRGLDLNHLLLGLQISCMHHTRCQHQ